MRNKIRKCKVCDKKIKIKEEHIGIRSPDIFGRKGLLILTSDEGVLYDLETPKTWFCNDCWAQIIKPIEVPIIA